MELFVQDLRRSVRAAAGGRWLLPVAIAVGLVGIGTTAAAGTSVGIVAGLLVPVWLVVWAGWLGTERVVIARAARGEELDARNAWGSVRILGPRFIRLALALLPLGLLLVLAGGTLGAASLRYRLVLAVVVLAVGIGLTFVTPALVFTTSRLRDAVPIGWRLLRTTWPETWAHAVVPAATMAAVAALALDAVVWVLAVEVLALVFRGATALRYVDLVDVAWADVPGGVWRRRVTEAPAGLGHDVK